MKKFLMIGHTGFYNRGNEAIIRCTVDMLRARFADIKVSIYSRDCKGDCQSMGDPDVEFLPAQDLRRLSIPWLRSQTRRIPVLRNFLEPYTIPSKQAINDADCILSVGGDFYTLDYGIPSFLLFAGQRVLRAHKPLVIWAASIGPFESMPKIVPRIRKHFQSTTLITARDGTTLAYLQEIGITSNVCRVADPAFTLPVSPVDLKSFWPHHNSNGILGVCVSPLLARYLTNGGIETIAQEVAIFVEQVVQELGISVLLVPHVIRGGNTISSQEDFLFLDKVRSLIRRRPDRVGLMPDNLNAMETKFLISQCRFFMGSRMHSTIASMSSGVPTISIAYSMKAKGINLDIFGDEKYMVDCRRLDKNLLLEGVRKLIEDEKTMRETLARRIPEMKVLAQAGVEELARTTDWADQ